MYYYDNIGVNGVRENGEGYRGGKGQWKMHCGNATKMHCGKQ